MHKLSAQSLIRQVILKQLHRQQRGRSSHGRKNVHLQAAVEEYVAHNNANGDFPGLVHRAIAWAKAAELPPPPPKPAPAANPLRTVDSFGRAVRRSTAQLKALDLSADVDRTTARKKLDTCLANLEELRRTVEALKAGLAG